MTTIPRRGDNDHELEALLRLAAADRLIQALLQGEWMPDDYVLEYSELLIRQARRRLALGGGPELRAA